MPSLDGHYNFTSAPITLSLIFMKEAGSLIMIINKLQSRLLLVMLFLSINVYAQKPDSVKTKADTVKQDFVTRMQAFASHSAVESLSDFNADKASIQQEKALEELKKNIQKAKIYLKNGIDTLGAKAELKLINKDLATAGDAVFSNKGTTQTFRNLTTTTNILQELLNKTLVRKALLDIHQHELNNFRYQIDSLSSVRALFKFPPDSAGMRKYLQQLIVVAYEVHPVDSALKQTRSNIQSLLNEVNLAAFKLQSGIEEIEQYQKQLAKNSFKREFTDIWGPEGYFRPFNEILSNSTEKARLILSFYSQNNEGKILALFILIIITFIYLRSLKSIYTENNLLSDDFEGQLVLRHPLLSAIVITVNLFQFVFISPPFILSVLFWIISSVCLSVLFRSFIVKYWMAIWLAMVALFIIAAVDNLVLQASRTERWFMLVIAIIGVFTAIITLRKGDRSLLREKWIVYSIGFMGFLELCAVFADIFGRYNMAKSLLIAGYLNVIIAILFLWTVRMINEGLFLAYNVYTRQDKKLFYLNFEKVGSTTPPMFYVLLVFGWMVLLGRNFSTFENFINPLRDFFSQDRTIGDYTFSINGLLLFIAIMAISVMISKIVSFFASDHNLASDKDEKLGIQKIGSWLLLVRISILSIGLFLALASAGIPLDRITIVIGALGVGIGFGLQTLVNNLVSGLIIAFEKPVNVGDTVDVGGTTGTMKSVGFRSSIIATVEGADVVIPNGDLLSAHLTNWSLGGNRKRIPILIGVGYDADLENAKQVVTDILEAEERLAKNPHYIVQYEQFNASSIDLRIYFWAKRMGESNAIRSDLIIKILKAFNDNGIAIPFPQQDIHIHRLIKGDNNKV
jgi:potassium efflux system protein